MNKNVVIETKDLTKKYDGTTVVDHLNLHIYEGEIFGILGPNGAGKTTTILMLLGLTEPAAGTASVCGYNATREPLKVKRLVGYMPEKVGFYDNLTPRQNLKFIAELNSLPYAQIDGKVDEILKAVGLGKQADQRVGTFSRGMKQRLGIADALIKDPRVVILDEPTAGLDPEGINQILDLIASLPKRGTTVALSSHQLYQVQRVCHSIAIFSKGKVVIEGSLDDLGRKAFTEGHYRIELEVAQSSPALVETLSKVPGVTKVEAQDNLLIVSANSDLRSELARTVVQSNVPLIQMKIQQFSLDAIYMKYFQEKG